MNFTHPEYLVQTDWLAEHLTDNKLRILDVTAKLTSRLVNRAEEDCFNPGHIPGSVFFDVPAGKGVLSDKEAALPWTWPNRHQFESTMGEFGVDNDTHVIVVARTPREGLDSGTMWCTRAWWTMHHFGVNCSILEGGVEKWEAEGYELSSLCVEPRATTFVAKDDYIRGLASKEDVLASITTGSACIVDSLTEADFEGTSAGYGPRKGHIKNAVNVPFRSLIKGETARFTDAGDLQQSLSELMKQPKVITYCGGAIAATVDAFALKLLGYDNVAVYDGSLMEWSVDESLPMVDPNPAAEI